MIRIDARGMRCPWPAIRAARGLRENPGVAIEILADDPAAERELGALAERCGGFLTVFDEDGIQVLRISP